MFARVIELRADSLRVLRHDGVGDRLGDDVHVRDRLLAKPGRVAPLPLMSASMYDMRSATWTVQQSGHRDE